MVLAEAENEEEIGVGRRKEGGRRCRKEEEEEEGLLALLPLCPAAVPPPISPHPKAPPLPAPLIQLLSRDKSPTSLLPIALSPSLLSPHSALLLLQYY